MKGLLKAISLILFGILLCCADRGLNTTLFYYTSDIPFSLFGVILGIVGLCVAFSNNESK